jgi:hypothetical protein
LIVYSSLNASIGLILVALNAGIKPINVPKITNKVRAINTTAIDTEAFTITASSPCPNAESNQIKIQPPDMIPSSPATSVKNTAS